MRGGPRSCLGLVSIASASNLKAGLLVRIPIDTPVYSRQGEEVPEVPEEEDWIARPRQEEEGGDAGGPAGHEEEGRCLIFCCTTRQQQPSKVELIGAEYPVSWLHPEPFRDVMTMDVEKGAAASSSDEEEEGGAGDEQVMIWCS